MRYGPRATALAAALCLLPAFTASAQPAEPTTNLQPRVTVAGRKAAISQWFRAESPHFVVYSDAGEDDVAQLLGNLEKLDQLLRAYTLPSGQAERQEPKLTLYFHSSASDLREIDAGLPANAVGLYSSCAAGVQGFGVHLEQVTPLGDAQLDKAPLNDTLSHVFEAYARHFLYRHTDIRTPPSFIDGFAQYFSSVRFSDQQVVVGRAPKGLGAYLKFLGDGREYSLNYDDVLEENLAGARNYAGAAGVRLEYEAKAWLLTHYMFSSDENRKRLNTYLVLVGRGVAPTPAFERAFGLKKSDISDVMWRYGLKGLAVVRAEQAPLPAARVNFRSLPQAAGEFVLANAVLKSCPGRAVGEGLLKQLATLAPRFPSDDLARLTLSRAQIDWGNPQDALAPLNAVLQGDDASFEARYLLGMAHLRLAERHEGDARRTQVQTALRHLQRARELNPRSAEAALGVFRAEAASVDGPGPAALEGVITAWRGSRDVDALGRSAALAFAFTGKADDAHKTLGTMAQNLRDAPSAQWAKQWQGRLEAGVTRGDILAEMRRAPGQDASFKEWTLAKDRALQEVERNHGLAAADNVIKEVTRQNDSATGTTAPGSIGNR
ncbi:hypothetical protein [Roseateles asaccharophilus]|uniref:Tetratricopeptide (TPR) repeat protein n=1 Tax=Roseateles asaccharophilus TaxID=582607 RepID=A0ABU2A3U0_9BURK|nr:hypothetical protein [Roseateles asaccharophilus]MDR7331816.1 tetratricopeptide (TPR) repeat protein [Roseateles asaccharophilus]